MVKIPARVKEFLKTHLAYIATVDGNGQPNVVPKGSVAVLDDDHLAFADLYAHQTKKNLLRNPRIAVVVVNPASYEGYQLKGKAKVIARGKEYDAIARAVAGEGQLGHIEAKYAVKIKVSKVIDIGYTETADRAI